MKFLWYCRNHFEWVDAAKAKPTHQHNYCRRRRRFPIDHDCTPYNNKHIITIIIKNIIDHHIFSYRE